MRTVLASTAAVFLTLAAGAAWAGTTERSPAVRTAAPSPPSAFLPLQAGAAEREAKLKAAWGEEAVDLSILKAVRRGEIDLTRDPPPLASTLEDFREDVARSRAAREMISAED